MTRRGKLIVLDGIDGAGKSTQADRLVERLNAVGNRAVRIAFPRYETFVGQTIRRYLRGELGDASRQSAYLVSLLFATDRWAAKHTLEEALKAGTTVVLDRYVPSNMCFQAARLPVKARATFRAWLDELEYELFQLPRTDVFIYLSIPIALSDSLIARRGGQREAYEADRKLVAGVVREYVRLCKTEPSARVVQCTQGGNLLTIDAIHERIWVALATLIGGHHE